MKKLKNQEVEFQIVIRPIPSTNAYSVVLGEVVDGQFHPTDRWPANHCVDFACLQENPLAPGQDYVLAERLNEVVGPLALEWDSCMLISGFLVFTTKDFPNEESSEKEE